MNFSVLFSTYKNDSPAELEIALKSIWQEQTVKPTEIVIVKDGPLTPQLDAVIDKFAENGICKIVPLEHNLGLGGALCYGVEACSCDYIARMDSDDISLPDRFAKQVAFMEIHPEITICGGMIQEFDTDPSCPSGMRVLPEEHDQIIKFLKTRNPFNHVTVFLKKTAIIAVGNYQPLTGYEDYWLWARLLCAGYLGANLPDILVNVRTGNNMIGRRRGWKIFRAELRLASKLKQLGILSSFEMFRNMILKGGVRLLPASVLSLVYRKLRGKK